MKNTFKMLKLVSSKSKKYIFIRLISAITAAIISLFNVVILKIIIDEIEKGTEFSEIVILIVIMFCIIATIVIIDSFTRYLKQKYELKIKKSLKNDFYDKINKIDPIVFEDAKLYDSFTRASLVTEQKAIDVVSIFLSLFEQLLSLAGIVSIIIYLDSFTLIVSIVVLILSIITSSLYSMIEYKEYDKQVLPNREQAYINNLFTNKNFLEDIKFFAFGKLLKKKYNERMDTKQKVLKEFSFKKGILYWLKSLMDVSFMFIVVGYLAYKVSKGLTIGSLTALILAAQSFLGILSSLFSTYPQLKKESFFVNDYFVFLNIKESIDTNIGIINELDYFPTIKAKNVNFKYPGSDKLVFSELNFKINPFEKIAIVGLNGAGKTTLSKIITRFYDIESGDVLLGDYNIKEYNSIMLRNDIAFVSQHYQSYQFSIAENILMRPYQDSDYDTIMDVLKKVGLYDRVMSMEDTIFTPIGKMFTNKGTDFSGGEKQRLAIARVLIKNPKLIIMDEPTSALDPKAEYEINNLLLELANNKMVMVITHRLSTVIHMDRICYIENGKIVEEGTHNDLLNLGGKYSELFRIQASNYQLKDVK